MLIPSAALPPPSLNFNTLLQQMVLHASSRAWDNGKLKHTWYVSGSGPGKTPWGISVQQVTDKPGEKIMEPSPEMFAYLCTHRIAQAVHGLRADNYHQCRNVGFGKLLNLAE